MSKKKGYNIRCDYCGKFLSYENIGASLFTPDSEVSEEDHQFRCIKCTKKYGNKLTHRIFIRI